MLESELRTLVQVNKRLVPVVKVDEFGRIAVQINGVPLSSVRQQVRTFAKMDTVFNLLRAYGFCKVEVEMEPLVNYDVKTRPLEF